MTKVEKLQRETERKLKSARRLVKHAMEKLEKCFISNTDDSDQEMLEGNVDDKRRKRSNS